MWHPTKYILQWVENSHKHMQAHKAVQDALCGIKDLWPILTITYQIFTTQTHHDIHQVQHFPHPMTAHIFNDAGPLYPEGPHHYQELFQEVSSRIYARSTGNWSRSGKQD